MEKQWLCTKCYHNWKSDEKITTCCPVCGANEYYQIGKVKLEL